MRGTTLTKLLDMYRAECRMSLNVNHNTVDRDRQIAHIQRTQEWLWEDFNWPTLRVERTIDLAAGQKTYEPPEDMHIDRIEKAEVWYSQAYLPLRPGIDAVHYTAYNPDLDQREWPPRRWRITEDEQIEVWPLPSQDADTTTLEGRVKLTGIRNLRALVTGTDVADLDDRLIILFCAAEYLAGSGGKDASLKLDQANKRYGKLRGAQQKRRVTRMFGCSDERRVERVPIAVYNSTS
jgi:hypothetical protein